MTTVASLTIEMAANVARLQADMARAANTVQSATAKMQKAAETAGRALGAIGAGLTVAAFTGFIRGAINAADETSKLSQKIGVTVKDVAGLQLAFRQAGVSQEAMATGLARLSKGIAEGNDGLKSLGIATKNNDGTLKTSRQVLAEVADQFAKTGDGATKTARAQEIFGKTGADLIPLLNAGSKALDEYDALASKLGLTLSDETAKQAEAFNDTLDLVGQGVQGVGRQVAAQLLPTLTGLASEFFNTVSSGDNLKKTADFLAAALKGLYSAGVIGVEIFSSLGKTLGGVAAAVVAAVSGNFKQAGTIIGDLQSDVGTGWKEALAQVDRAWNTTGDNTVANLAQINKAQMTSTKSLEDGKKAAQEYAKFLDQMRGKVAELSGVNADYIKQLEDFDKARKKNLVTEAQYIALVAQLIAKQPGIIKLAKEQADAIKQVSDAEEDGLKIYAAYLSELSKGVITQRERIAALELEAEAERLAEALNISLAKAVELVNVAKLEERRLSERDPAVIKALEDEIAARKRIAELTGNKDAREVNKQAAQDAANEWKRFTDDLERGLTDSLFRAFEAGRGFFSTLWDGIKNLFKTTVLKLAIQGVVGSVLGSVGLSSAAQTATSVGGSGLSTLSNLGSLASTASGFGAAFGTSFGANLSAAFSSGFSTLGLSLEAGFASIAQGTVTGIASGLGSLAAVAAPVAAVALVANALGLFRSNKIVDGGISGTLGGQVNDYALNRRGGTLFSGPDYSVRDLGVSAQNQALQDAYSAIRNTVSGMAVQLGIGNEAIKDFTVQLGNDLIHPDTGGFGIKTQGLSQDEILKKIEAALLSANEQLAAFALGTTEFTRDGETAVQTLAGLTGSLQTFNGTFKLLGLTLADTSLAGADATRTFIESFGGAEQFAQITSSFYQNFYTEAERTANTVEALRQRFFELGTAGATTREGFRALVEEQQRLHGATAPVVAELLKLESTFASVVPAAASAADAIAGASRAFGLINTNSGLRAATEAEANAAADRRELLAGRRATAERTAVNAQELAAAASAAAAQAATDAANARADAERVLRQAYDSEIRALDEIVNARAAAVQALETAYNTERGVLEQRIGQFDGFAKSLRDFIAGLSATLEIPTQTTERLRARFQSTLNAALGGDASAISALPGVGNSYIGALGQSAQTELELRRGIAEIAISTQGAAESAEAQKSTAELQLESLNQQVAGLLELNASVLTVSEAITALEQASDAAVQAEAQKAILTAQVSSLITLNESVLSVRDAILALDKTKNPSVGTLPGIAAGQGASAYSGAGTFSGPVAAPTAAGIFGAENILASAGNFVVAKDANGSLRFATVDSAGTLLNSGGDLDNENIVRQLISTGAYQDRTALNETLISLADQLDSQNLAYLPGQLYGQGSDAGVDFRDLANGGFGGNNFTVDLNAALKGPTGYGTLQQNQRIAELLGVAGANNELTQFYQDLSFLQEGLGLGAGGTSPITVDELSRYRIPGFASGGDFAGGWRMVGERGPELEFTPPSRIFSNSQTNALLDNSGVEKRLEQLEKTLMVGMATVAKHTADTTRLLQIWNGDGLPETRESDGATAVVIGV